MELNCVCALARVWLHYTRLEPQILPRGGRVASKPPNIITTFAKLISASFFSFGPLVFARTCVSVWLAWVALLLLQLHGVAVADLDSGCNVLDY